MRACLPRAAGTHVLAPLRAAMFMWRQPVPCCLRNWFATFAVQLPLPSPALHESPSHVAPAGCLHHTPIRDTMADFTVRTRKFMRNAVCGRRQMVVDVLHPGVATISKQAIKKALVDMYSANSDLVFTFGFRTGFGGDKTTGFAYVYDTEEAAKKMEPRHRLIALGWAEARTRKRGAWKDAKKKIKSTWGTGRRAAARKAKRAAM